MIRKRHCRLDLTLATIQQRRYSTKICWEDVFNHILTQDLIFKINAGLMQSCTKYDDIEKQGKCDYAC